MKIIFRHIIHKSTLAAAPALLAAMALFSAGCNNTIYDDEEDCSVSYRLNFRYDRNMKWSDAFASEVRSAHVYAYNPEGELVWEKCETVPEYASESYSMALDLPPGNYHLVAWCGLNHTGSGEEHFSVSTSAGAPTLDNLTCRLGREQGDEGGAVSRKRLDPLFHGTLDVSLVDDSDESVAPGVHTLTMGLTKNTNHVRVILQHLSGEDVDVNDFIFSIEEENGLMGHDNALLPDEPITYMAHDKRAGTAGMGIDDYPTVGTRSAFSGEAPASEGLTRATITSVSVAIADLTIARLIAGRQAYLTIKNREGEPVARRIPLTDYALLLKDEYLHKMTDQEYLDRQDEYALTFFLDRNDKWIGTSIIINSWKVVFNDVDFD